MIGCFLVAAANIVCLVTYPGIKQVECVKIEGINLCVDSHMDTSCYQDTLKEWVWEGLSEENLVELINEECG